MKEVFQHGKLRYINKLGIKHMWKTMTWTTYAYMQENVLEVGHVNEATVLNLTTENKTKIQNTNWLLFWKY
jgi:hypothetical protein